jgi:uncharacterized protein (DUF1697 family)
MQKYVALLRGINVGGNNIIKMTELRTCFEKVGFSDVKTYIQSGNVIFTSSEKNTQKLEKKIEKELQKVFGYTGFVVIISKEALRAILKKAPKNFGGAPELYRYDVIFLKSPMTSEQALPQVETKDGVDTIARGKNALYFSRLTAKASSSRMSKLIQNPVYKYMTIRNWRTCNKISELL